MKKGRLPKLAVTSFINPDQPPASITLEEAAEQIRFQPDYIVLVDGRIISSHEELAKMLDKEEYRTKDSVEVLIMPYIDGG